jgi:hypothetical protein
LFGPDGIQAFGLIASFYWGCHPNTPEAEAKMVDEVESLVELLAALRNASPLLIDLWKAAKALSSHRAKLEIAEDDDKFYATQSVLEGEVDRILTRLESHQ